jgi:uncharacterized protein
MATAAVVHAFLEGLKNGDVDGITELFAEEIDWWAPGTVLPWAGRRSRRSEVSAFFSSLESACVPAATRVEVEKVLIDGEDAVVFGTYHRMFAKNGRSFDTRGRARPGRRRQDRALASVRGHRPRRGRMARPLSRLPAGRRGHGTPCVTALGAPRGIEPNIDNVISVKIYLDGQHIYA